MDDRKWQKISTKATTFLFPVVDRGRNRLGIVSSSSLNLKAINRCIEQGYFAVIYAII